MNFRQKSIYLAAAIALPIVLSACGHDSKPNALASTSTTATPPTTSVNDVILRDYRAFWGDYLAVTNPMTPGSPRIAAHATGDELAALNSTVVAGKASGNVFRGEIETSAHVDVVVGDTATLKDCGLDKTGQYSVATGARADKDDGQRQLLTVTMKLIDGVWKVAKIDGGALGCVPDSSS